MPKTTEQSRFARRLEKLADYLTGFGQQLSGYAQMIPNDHRQRALRSDRSLFPRPFIRSPLWLFVSCILSVGLVFTRDLWDALAGEWQTIDFFDDFFLIRGGLVAAGIGIYMLWFLYLEERLCIYEARIQTEKIHRLSNEKRLLESRLKLLQAQVEPHFLFNTLTSIVSLDDTDPERARTMHIDFMLYLDETFNKMRSDRTTVGQEVKLIRAYLDIFKIRMGRRLAYTIKAAETLEAATFPSMLIQPVVENAIKHGLEPAVSGGRIDIAVSVRGSHLCWEVADTGAGIAAHAAMGIGLRNVMDRLFSLFGSDATFQIEDNVPRGTKVTIEVPYA